MGKNPTEVKIKIGMNPNLEREREINRDKDKKLKQNERAFKFIYYIMRHSNNHKILVLPFFWAKL